MRSAQVPSPGGPDIISLVDLPVPEPGQGQVRIRVAYSPLNPLDTHARAERIKWQHPGFPFVPGYECAGLVDQVGPDVDATLLGKRVSVNANWGGNAEYVLAPAANLNHVPEAFDWKTASTFSTCAYTSWLLIHSAGQVQPGQTVVIHSAAGAVGTLCTQIAKTAGAMVIGLAGGEAKMAYAKSFGADHVFDYNQTSWPDEVKAVTQDRGADLIIDGNQGPNLLKNFSAIAPMGNVILMGASAGPGPDINPSMLIGLSCSVTGFVQYFHQAKSGGQERTETHEKLASGEWRIPIEKIYELEDVAEAHRAWENRELMGRTLVRIGGDL